jgi:hypothetical protein
MKPGVALVMWLVGLTVLLYISVPLFLRRLKTRAPDLFLALGQPELSQLFSRNPRNFGKQFRFMGFVLTGRAGREVPASLRALYLCVWLAYAGILVWLAYFLYLVATGSLPR